MSDKDFEKEIRQASHDAMIQHLNGTPDRQLLELIEGWREKSEHTEVFKPQAARGMELVYKKCAEQLEDVISTASTKQCGKDGPESLVCTRHGDDHTAHVTYTEVSGELMRVEWFDCNPLGEPKNDN